MRKRITSVLEKAGVTPADVEPLAHLVIAPPPGTIDVDRRFKRPFGAAPAGVPQHPPLAVCRGSPPERLAARRCAAPCTLAGAGQALRVGVG